MGPVFANKIPGLRSWTTPMDFGKKYRGKRIFGDNKRWRGVVFGTLLAGLVGYVEFQFAPKISLPITSTIMLTVLASMLMGFGALVGDAVESFTKRRAGIDAGHSWFPFDQIDYIIGGLLFSWPFVHWNVYEVGYIFLVYFGLHLLFSYLGYLLKLKDKPI